MTPSSLPRSMVANEEHSFRVRFSTYYGFAEEDFNKMALRNFMRWPWRLAVPLILKFKPETLKTDLEIIHSIGATTTYAELCREISELRNDYRLHNDFGWQRRSLCFRLSGKRIMTATKKIW